LKGKTMTLEQIQENARSRWKTLLVVFRAKKTAEIGFIYGADEFAAYIKDCAGITHMFPWTEKNVDMVPFASPARWDRRERIDPDRVDVNDMMQNDYWAAEASVLKRIMAARWFHCRMRR